MTDDILRLNEKQIEAWEELKAAFKKCEEADIEFFAPDIDFLQPLNASMVDIVRPDDVDDDHVFCVSDETWPYLQFYCMYNGCCEQNVGVEEK